MGNINSVFNAIEFLGYNALVLDNANMLKDVDKIILPGVGAFSEGMKRLHAGNWCDILKKECIENKKPILGICLGMQLLASESYEFGHCYGLNFIRGTVKKIEFSNQTYRLPHIGWNEVCFKENSQLYLSMETQQDFYFVHSFVFQPENKNYISGVCNYGVDFSASVEKENIFGTQYHPEKSHKMGLNVLNNFVRYGGE